MRLVQPANQDGTDLAGGADVSAAAGAAVQSLDGDDPQRALALGRPAQVQVRAGLLAGDPDRAVLEDQLIGAHLGGHHLRRIERNRGHVDGGYLGAQMKANRLRLEQIDQHSRQQVLPAVLLHVIEAARPVDAASDFVASHRSGGDVRDPLVLLNHFEDRDAGNHTQVVRLAARGGIESGLIEIEAAAVRASLNDAPPELSEVAVVVVQARGHALLPEGPG